MAGPGVKGGHCSDAYKSLSSKPARCPQRAAKLLILGLCRRFLGTIRRGSRLSSDHLFRRLVGSCITRLSGGTLFFTLGDTLSYGAGRIEGTSLHDDSLNSVDATVAD